MIHTISVKCSSHDSDIKLDSLIAFEGSLISVRIIDVPKRIGTWDITNVYFTFQNGNEIVSKECVKTNGVWVATTDSVAEPMTSWYRISAKGIDENGETVEAYNLGQGDITILDTDGTIHIGDTEYYVHLLDTLPEVPKKGDMLYFQDTRTWNLYDGTQWVEISSKIEVATKDKIGGIRATEGFIELNEDGDIVSLQASHAQSSYEAQVADEAKYARKVDDETEGLSEYAKKSELKKPVFSCTFVNNQTNDINQKVTLYKFLRVGEMTIQQQIKYISVSVKAKSQQKFYTEMTDDTEGVSLALGDVYMTYTDTTGKQKSVYKVRAIDSNTYADVDWTKDIVATSINGAIDVGVSKITAGNNITISPASGTGAVTVNAVVPSLPIATNLVLGGIKATPDYIEIGSDGNITRLDADYARSADECYTANNASHADWADNASNAEIATQANDLAQTAIDTVLAYTDTSELDAYAFDNSVVGRIKALESGGGGGGEEGDESLVAIYLEGLESDFVITGKDGSQQRLRDGSYVFKRSQVETFYYGSMVISISIDGCTSSGGTFQKNCLVTKTIGGKNYIAKNYDYMGNSSFNDWTATRLGLLEGVTFHIFGDFTGIYLMGDS